RGAAERSPLQFVGRRPIEWRGAITRQINETAAGTKSDDDAVASDEVWRDLGGRCAVHCARCPDYRAGSEAVPVRGGGLGYERSDQPVDRGGQDCAGGARKRSSGSDGRLAEAA